MTSLPRFYKGFLLFINVLNRVCRLCSSVVKTGWPNHSHILRILRTGCAGTTFNRSGGAFSLVFGSPPVVQFTSGFQWVVSVSFFSSEQAMWWVSRLKVPPRRQTL